MNKHNSAELSKNVRTASTKLHATHWSLKKRTIECKLRKQGKKAGAVTILTGDALAVYLNQQQQG